MTKVKQSRKPLENRCVMCEAPFYKKKPQQPPYLCRKCAKKFSDKKYLSEHMKELYDNFINKVHLDEKKTKKTDDITLIKGLKRIHGKTILEIGCGTEFSSRHIPPDNIIIVSDIATEDAKQTAKKVKGVHGLCLDANRIPLADSSVDVAYSNQLVEHLPEIERHIKEVARVLKTGGTYLFATPNNWLASPYYKSIGAYDINVWHPSTLSPTRAKRLFKRNGFRIRFIPNKQISPSVQMKLPNNRTVRAIAVKILTNMPYFIQPNLICVARKEKHDV